MAFYSEGRRDSQCDPCNGGIFLHRIAIGGPGDDRINGIVVDQVDESVIITGFFSQTVDFNPNGDPHLEASQGGKDIFVARYTWDGPAGCYTGPGLLLDWVYTYGTSADDEGLDVALDVNGDVYAVGYHAPGSSCDMFVAKVKREQASADAVAEWDFNASSQQPGYQIASGVAVDGLDRVLITGRFGCSHPLLCQDQGNRFDFDPGAGTDIRYSNGGGDVFVARYYPANGLYDGVFTFGGELHDGGTDIATDPNHTQTVAHAGYFGAPDAASSGYTMDLDPDPGVTSAVESTGAQDGFSSLLRTDWITGNLKNIVAIVLDSTGYTRPPGDPPQDFDEFTKMTWTYAGRLGIDIPQDGTAAVAVFLHGLSSVYGSEPGGGATPEYEDLATQVMPWTVLDPVTRPLFASRLRAMPRWHGGIAPRLDAALNVSTFSFEDSPLSDVACFRSIHLLAGAPNQLEPDDSSGAMIIARNGTIGSPFVDRIDGFAVPNEKWFDDLATPAVETGRGYFDNYGTASDGPVAQPFHVFAQTPQEIPGVGWPSFDTPYFEDLVSRLLKRVGFCPGDFNLDGVVDSVDVSDYLTAAGASPPDPRTDWDFDGTAGTGADWTAFQASHAQGCCQ